MSHTQVRLGRLIAAMLLMAVLSTAHGQPVGGEAAKDPAAAALFESRVKPILTQVCGECHGEHKQKGELRLDSFPGLMRGGELGPVVVAGNPEASMLVRAVRYTEEKLQMPPKRKLAPEQVAAIEQWVRLGMPWPGAGPVEHAAPPRKQGMQITDEHRRFWAYQPVKVTAPPTVKNPAWAMNPIDAFILARLDAAGLSPNHPADRRELVRRIYFDLIGLPPTPQESAAFVNDPSPGAYAALLEKLLASPHYGEKWGRYWLDLVRYAETNGYERDSAKAEAWRYRDYVVDAFNHDKPYDQFVREQLAGDELEHVTLDSLTATGFYRLGTWDDEPADRDQAFYDNLDDIVTTTGQALLAMTINCARCHDHKKDPISQADYYKLLAFFRNISGNMRDAQPAFVNEAQRKSFDDEVAQRRAQASGLQKQITAMEERVITAASRSGQRPGQLTGGDLDGLRFRFYRDTWDRLPDFASLKHEDEGAVESGLFDLSLRTRDTAFGFVFDATLIVPQEGTYTFYLDSDDGSRLSIDGRVVVVFDGIHGVGDERTGKVGLKQGRAPIRLEYFQKHHGLGLRVQWSGPGFTRRELSTPRSYNPLASPGGPTGKPRELKKLMETDGPRVLGSAGIAEYRRLKARVEELAKPPQWPRRLMMSEDGPGAPETFVLIRGSPHAPGDKVSPGFPAVLGVVDPSIPKPAEGARTAGRRRALAEWIVSPANPLTARVMVNRVWQGHFGRGIVRSSSDFGRLGDLPTHPELLDYLAAKFVAGGWKIKQLHRLILMSNAYQMSSHGNPAGLSKDPNNDLLWRFDMRRLTAEEVRDAILAVNGTLNLKLGGPSIYTEVPRAVLATASRPDSAWGKSPPDEQVRRSLYIHRKRSLVEPMLSTFDVPDTDSSCAVRFATTVPTQALTMLNSDFMQKQTTALADRLQREAGGDPAAQARLALRLVRSREPSDADVARGVKLMQSLQHTQHLSPRKSLEAFCLLALNLNEFIYLD